MRPNFLILLREYLVAFAVIFAVFTLLRYFGWLNFSGTRGDLPSSMRAELVPSLIWALALVALRLVRKR